MNRPSVEEIVENFELFDDWEDRYRYLIELGRDLPQLQEAEKTEQNRVSGCTSQVWLVVGREGAPPVMKFRADSDAFIVRGLIALLLAIYDGKPAAEVAQIDALQILSRIGLEKHLSPNRRSGLAAIAARMRAEGARAAG